MPGSGQDARRCHLLFMGFPVPLTLPKRTWPDTPTIGCMVANRAASISNGRAPGEGRKKKPPRGGRLSGPVNPRAPRRAPWCTTVGWRKVSGATTTHAAMPPPMPVPLCMRWLGVFRVTLLLLLCARWRSAGGDVGIAGLLANLVLFLGADLVLRRVCTASAANALAPAAAIGGKQVRSDMALGRWCS